MTCHQASSMWISNLDKFRGDLATSSLGHSSSFGLKSDKIR